MEVKFFFLKKVTAVISPEDKSEYEEGIDVITPEAEPVQRFVK